MMRDNSMYNVMMAGEEKHDVFRKDVVDLKRGLNEEIQEKELIAKTAGELRQTIKREEADIVELQRIIQEAKHRIGSEYTTTRVWLWERWWRGKYMVY